MAYSKGGFWGHGKMWRAVLALGFAGVFLRTRDTWKTTVSFLGGGS